MENQKQIVERLKQANNVLVTVSNDPSVDQLAACIGLSLVLNKLDKHAAAVYSGQTPSTIEFLQPGETIEKTTDSLRDFIISLDKSKADKLRYKVEDSVVRIFITPYRTSISSDDLDFSQGDFNVDVVVALGVHEQQDLDQAITAHGRILHDATVVTVNNQQAAELGSINWLDETASSLSEMVTKVAQGLSKESFDEQTATALLTGVVAETARFSNEKTSAETMKVSATLMAAGANQQLVATKLEAPSEPEQPEETPAEDGGGDSKPDEALPEAAVSDDGTLRIDHKTDAEAVEQPTEGTQPPAEEKSEPKESTSTEGQQQQPEQPQQEQKPPEHEYPEISQVRAVGGAAEPGDPTAAQQSGQGEGQGPALNSQGESEDESFVSPMSLPKPEPEIQRHDQPILSHGEAPVHEGQPEQQQEQKPPEPEQPTPSPEPPKPQASEPPKQAQDTPAPSPPEPPKAPEAPAQAPPANAQQPEDTQSLSEIEHKVHSPHLEQSQGQAPAPAAEQPSPQPADNQNAQDELNLSELQHPDGSGAPPVTSKESDEGNEDAISAARDAVAKATAESGDNETSEPIQALNAQPLGEPLHQTAPPMPEQKPESETGMNYEETPAPGQQAPQQEPQQAADQSMTMPLPQPGQAPAQDGQNGQEGPNGEGNSDQQPPAPSAPPPIMPPPQG